MNPTTKSELKRQLVVLTASNTAFRSTLSLHPPPAFGGLPAMPIDVAPALMPYLAGLRMHADNFDKLIKLVEGLIDGS